ncbi:MAG: Spy/CpxP family protein refolding chaperone [Paludibacter sp.]|nr:Spy/CpxP family protein refolding chaperone [Paludibacter sp.]
MKKQILFLLLAVFVTICTNTAQTPQGQGNRQPNPQVRAEQMAKDLNLTEVQKQQLQALFEEQQTKMKALRESGEANQESRKEELKKLRSEWDSKLEGIIGKENMEKHKAMMKEKASETKKKKKPEN